MAVNGFIFRSGPWELDKSNPTAASTAYTAGDAEKNNAGVLAIATAGAKVVGVLTESKASTDTSTNQLQIIKALPGRTKFLAGSKNSGNLVAADKNKQVDLFGATGAMGFDRAVTTNGDITIDRVLATGTSGQALIYFADPYTLSSV